MPDKSNSTGLVSATLGLTFYIEDSHFAPRSPRARAPAGSDSGALSAFDRELDDPGGPRLAREMELERKRGRDSSGSSSSFFDSGSGLSPSSGSGIQEKELWVLCEATMPPIEGQTFPFTRELYLGSMYQTFDHYQSSASSLPST